MKTTTRILVFGICIGLANAAFAFDITGVVRNIGGGGEGEKPKASAVLGFVPGGEHIGNALKLGEAAADAADNQFGPLEEFYLGRAVSARLIGNYPPLPQDSPATEYVRRVGATIALASDLPYPYRPYTFIVVRADEVNAFAAPGGFVFVTTGMLEFLKNEDELAGVLGHEISHVELHHGVRSIKSEDSNKLLMTAASVAADEVNMPVGASTVIQFSDKILSEVTDQVQHGYNAKLEGEADRRGIELARAAGYSPGALVDVIARFKETKNTYGGANYPKEREEDGREVLAKMGGGNAEPAPERTVRYAQALKTLEQ